jgi:hypothetical protein
MAVIFPLDGRPAFAWYGCDLRTRMAIYGALSDEWREVIDLAERSHDQARDGRDVAALDVPFVGAIFRFGTDAVFESYNGCTTEQQVRLYSELSDDWRSVYDKAYEARSLQMGAGGVVENV